MLDIKDTATGISFKIYVQPKASKNAVVGIHGDALKIRLTAPPVDGAANKMCVQYLAKVTGFPKSAIEIVSGHTGRTKQIAVHCDKKTLPRKHAVEKIKNLTATKNLLTISQRYSYKIIL